MILWWKETYVENVFVGKTILNKKKFKKKKSAHGFCFQKGLGSKNPMIFRKEMFILKTLLIIKNKNKNKNKIPTR